LTPAEDQELAAAAADQGMSWTAFALEALAAAMADWHERQDVDRRQRQEPIEVERRSGRERRQT
jgi:hypothetical protein